jgi:hypothetical protein
MSNKIRYEIEVGGAKGYLAPLSFPVAEAAMGFVLQEIPRYLSAGEIILNSLWVRGSKKLQSKGEDFDEACLQAYAIIDGVEYIFKDNIITIPYTGIGKDGKQFTKNYKCEIKGEIDRDTLELCLGLIRPNSGKPKPLTAGKEILLKNWISGDKEVQNNDELLIAACTACFYLVNMKGSKLKKV